MQNMAPCHITPFRLTVNVSQSVWSAAQHDNSYWRLSFVHRKSLRGKLYFLENSGMKEQWDAPSSSFKESSRQLTFGRSFHVEELFVDNKLSVSDKRSWSRNKNKMIWLNFASKSKWFGWTSQIKMNNLAELCDTVTWYFRPHIAGCSQYVENILTNTGLYISISEANTTMSSCQQIYFYNRLIKKQKTERTENNIKFPMQLFASISFCKYSFSFWNHLYAFTVHKLTISVSK